MKRWILTMTILCVPGFCSGQDSSNEPLPQVAEILKLTKELQELENDILAVKKRLRVNRNKTSEIWQKLVAKDEGRLNKLESQRREATQRLDAVNAAAKAERERRKLMPTPKQQASPAIPEVDPVFHEPFRRDRINGRDGFRDGDHYFEVGERFSLVPLFSKAQAEKNRKSLKQGHDPRYVMDLDNVLIVQVLDDKNFLATFREVKLRSPVFLMRGIDTSDIRKNNLHSWWVRGDFEVTGTYQYETRRGTLNTVFVLEYINRRVNK